MKSFNDAWIEARAIERKGIDAGKYKDGDTYNEN